MQRRTLDIIISTGGLGLVVLLLIGAAILRNEGNFARNYVKDQLAEQKITFTAAEKLTAEDKAFTEARSGCVIKYAGQPLDSGKKAECFANEYLGSHLSRMPAGAYPLTLAVAGPALGKTPNPDNTIYPLTYAELGTAQTELRAKITEARNAGDTERAAALQKELDSLTTARETVFKGEMLRGALLTTYGFSTLGERALLASNVALVAAGILAVLSVAGYVHAFVTPKTKAFAPVPGLTGQAA
ncbi:MAG TPA: hypothetical protein VNN10_13445 [Dehalococcoidia bacterium]|nr:hypothetical protein [Dehalococcoidia bacterium]